MEYEKLDYEVSLTKTITTWWFAFVSVLLLVNTYTK